MSAQDLISVSRELRSDIIEMAFAAKFTHLAGPLSAADLFATLYFGDILVPNRDLVVLSCGHYAPILYACLMRQGLVDKQQIKALGKFGGLPVHPERVEGASNISGVVASTGPLAQGMSVAVGLAIANKWQKKQSVVYCVCSDGELQEGQAWEAISLSVREKLGNLVWLIDNNNVQIGHFVTELAGNSSILQRLEAMGCNTLTVDGHDTTKIKEVLLRSRNNNGAPVAIVLSTVGGKGISFMENNPKWHDGKLTQEQYEQAMKELNV